MPIKADLYSFLRNNATTTNIYHRELPNNPVYPAIVYDIIDEIPFGRSHDTGVLPFREARLQINAYSTDIEEVEDIVTEYINLIGHYDGPLLPSGDDVSIRYESLNPEPEFEGEAILKNIEGRSMDFMVVYQ